MHLNPDGTSIANMWITLPAGAAVPARLTHRLTFNNQVFDGPEVIVATQPLPVLSRPFRGSDWLANGGPENTSDHRRATMPNGLTAQRFAIDWFQFWPDGKEFHGPSKDNKSYAAYGTEVLAVADAVVATVQDNIPENTPGRNSRAVPITSEAVGGNVVILDIGSSRYAVYAHLQPGSLRVKVGDRVQRGQVIALLGNSGNSTGPHLHFQVVDRNSLLDSEGVPYVIDSFEAFLPRSIREVRAKDKKYEKRENELPMGRELVRF
jgi:murein DD-endopeptidase MepM/ murein hydrolase activator NlpD